MTEKAKSNLITMEDGSQRDFKTRNILLMDDITTENDLAGVRFNLVTGKQVDCVIPKDAPVAGAMVFRGIKSYISDNVAGVYRDKDGETHSEDFELAVEEAVGQILENLLVTRTSGEALKGRGDLVRALSEIRAEANEALIAEGKEPVYDVSMEACKKTILACSEDELKVRRAKPIFALKLAQYAAERAAARQAKLEKKVASADFADII